MTVLIVTSTFLVDTLPFRGTGIRMAVTISFIQTMNIVGWERAGTDAVDTLQVGVVVTDSVYTATDHRAVLGSQRTNKCSNNKSTQKDGLHFSGENSSV